MKQMIADLINGNLSDAKRRAKSFSLAKIQRYLIEQGWGITKATDAAIYLKDGGQENFNRYCSHN